MAQTTITEALAELKVIDKRILTKQEFIAQHVLRNEAMRDPLEKDGGSVSAITSALQSIHDLNEQKIKIRRAIQDVNGRTTITVSGTTRPIADWLVWRRDVSGQALQFLRGVSQGIEQQRKQALARGFKLSDPDAAGTGDIVVNMNEQHLSDQIEEMEAVLGTLDGQLSLKNATVMIEY